MSTSWSKIERKIYNENPQLLKLERGQRFLSEYYGIIVATKIDFHINPNSPPFHVYGFDIQQGLPRSHGSAEIEIIGKEIKLDDVLFWLKKKDHFSITMKIGELFLFGYQWDFSKDINNQNESLIDYLLEL